MVIKHRRDVCRVLLAWSVLAVLLSRAVPANTVVLGSSSRGSEVFNRGIGFPADFIPSLSVVAAGGTGGTGLTNGAMVFDLSFIPKGTTITSASFTMSVGGSILIFGPPSLEILDYVGTSPTVSLSDFSLVTNPFTSLVGSIGNLPLNAPPGSIDVVQTFDVSAFIRSLVNNGTPYAGFEFQDAAGTNFGGAEYIPGSYPPILSITSPVFLTVPVPEPRSALLLALGMAAVLLVSIVARPLGITRRFAVGRTRR
jgi:hypothetical protein